MKQMLLFVAVVFIGIQSQLYAQSTLAIYASQGNLNDIIVADTLASGVQAHEVYKLVSLDTTYKFTGTIAVKSDITVEGVVDPVTNRPPTIQPAVLQDGSLPQIIFSLNVNGVKGNFKNLYFLALATNNTSNADGSPFFVSGDNVRLSVDHCVFDGWQAYGIGYNGQWDSFFINVCSFRNMVHPNQWYLAEVIRNTWPGEAYTDTMSFTGNTMLCVNAYAAAPVTKWYMKYFEFVNNNVLYTFKNPFFIFNITEAKINNNVFYGNYAGGVDTAEHPWWDNLWVPDSTYGVIALQPLSLDNATMFNSTVDSAAAEGLRNIEVKNNTYFWPTALTDFWTNWNNTQANTVRTPVWMNERTVAMFADDATYPYLVESGNVNVDPGFMAPLDPDILNGTSGNDIGLLAYFEQIRTGTAATDVWGYKMTQVGANADWTPIWPLPEANLVPLSIEEIETSPSVPSKFSLGNVYPNPFNPSAKIQYTLEQSGITNLQVYNVLGQHLMTLIENKFQNASTYEVSFDMSEFPTGTYFVVLRQGDNRSIQKMMLLK